MNIGRTLDAKETMVFATMSSPIGELRLTARDATGGALLTGVFTEAQSLPSAPSWREERAAFREPIRELTEYFAGTRHVFEVLLDEHVGTDFQRRVWRALRSIRFGDTATYSDIAKAIGRPTAARAVGAAVGMNPWSIVVPCHRVVGSVGSLTGFAGGIARKRWLLGHEGVTVQGGHDQADPKARIAATATRPR